MIFTTGTERFNLKQSDIVYIAIDPRTINDPYDRDEFFMDAVQENFQGKGLLLVPISASDCGIGGTIYHKNGKYRGYRLE